MRSPNDKDDVAYEQKADITIALAKTNEIVCLDFVTHSNGIAVVVVRFVPLVLLRVSQNLRPSA